EGDPPRCWLHFFPSFVSLYLPEGSVGTTTDPFPFPSLGAANGDVRVGAPPGCWLPSSPRFVSLSLPEGSVGTTTDAFPFPSLGAANDDVVVGGLSTVMAFADRPEVREVVRFLASPEFGQDWFTSGEGKFLGHI